MEVTKREVDRDLGLTQSRVLGVRRSLGSRQALRIQMRPFPERAILPAEFFLLDERRRTVGIELVQELATTMQTITRLAFSLRRLVPLASHDRNPVRARSVGTGTATESEESSADLGYQHELPLLIEVQDALGQEL